MENYDIHFCKLEEKEKLKKFINDNWKKDHILFKNEKLLDWQHYDKNKKRYNFVIAVSKETNDIDAIQGFIPTYQYDVNLKKQVDLWLAIWKVKEKIKTPLLGLSLQNFIVNELKPRSITIVGLSKIAALIYNKIKYTVGYLNHYYLVNNECTSFSLIDNFDKCYFSNSYFENNVANNKLKIKKVNNIDIKIDNKQNSLPQKSVTYYNNRYVLHPIYKYDIYAINENKKRLCYFITRIVEYNNQKAIRLVDIYGDLSACTKLSNFREVLLSILKENNAEYLDCYNYGINENIFLKMGFIKRKINSKIIIPNYFEPFERENVNLNFAFMNYNSCNNENNNLNLIFKGDGDQDRPNISPD